MPASNPWAEVDAVIDALLEQRQRMVVSFAAFCLERGLKAEAPHPGERKQTWQDRGRALYGAALFDKAVQEQLDAKKRVPAIRGDKGQASQRGQAPGRSEDERSAYNEFQGWSGAAEPSEDAPQASLDF